MQVRYLLLVVVLGMAIAAPSTAYAGFVNMGFETGTTGWDLYNPPGTGNPGNNVWSTGNLYTSDLGYDYPVPEGDSYLELHPGLPPQFDPAGPYFSEVASQAAYFTTAGEIVWAVAAFDSKDYQRDANYIPDPVGIYGNDRAKVEIYAGQWTAEQISKNLAGGLFDTPWERSVWDDGSQVGTDYLAVGDFADDPWTRWDSQPLGTGWYTLAYSIRSGLIPDTPLPNLEVALQSSSLHDVPEASSCALLGLGLGLFALVGYTRRRPTSGP